MEEFSSDIVIDNTVIDEDVAISAENRRDDVMEGVVIADDETTIIEESSDVSFLK